MTFLSSLFVPSLLEKKNVSLINSSILENDLSNLSYGFIAISALLLILQPRYDIPGKTVTWIEKGFKHETMKIIFHTSKVFKMFYPRKYVTLQFIASSRNQPNLKCLLYFHISTRDIAWVVSSYSKSW